MENIILIVLISTIVISAYLYIDKKRKKGVKCIGCPYANECAEKAKNGCTCNTQPKDIK